MSFENTPMVLDDLEAIYNLPAAGEEVHQAGESVEGSNGEIQSESVQAVGEVALSTEIQDPELSPTQQQYQKVILGLLDLPDFTFRSPNAGITFAQAHGMSNDAWDQLNRSLQHRLKIIEYERTSAKNRPPTGVRINVERLIQLADINKHHATKTAFLTPSLLIKLKDRLADTDHTVFEDDKEQFAERIGGIVAEKIQRMETGIPKRRRKNLPHKQRSKKADSKVDRREAASKQKEKGTKPISRELRFSFKVGKYHFGRTLSTLRFAKLDPTYKLLLAVGHSANIDQTPVQQGDYLLRLVNKGLPYKEAEPVSQETLIHMLDTEVENEFITQDDGRYTVTSKALEVLKPKAAKQDNHCTGVESAREDDQIPEIEEQDTQDGLIAERVFILTDEMLCHVQHTDEADSPWLLSPDNLTPILHTVAQLLGVESEEVAKKVIGAAKARGYISVKSEVISNGGSSTLTTVNARVTADGVRHVMTERKTRRIAEGLAVD